MYTPRPSISKMRSGDDWTSERYRSSDSWTMRSRRSRSLTSRTVPWAPLNSPSSKIPTADSSVGKVLPSLRRTTKRRRRELVPGSWSSSHDCSAVPIDSSATMAEKCMPVISAAVQPNRSSAVSARNVNRPSASLRQITSGVVCTRPR